MSAMPQISSAKAIGMPMAIAPSNEPMKIGMVNVMASSLSVPRRSGRHRGAGMGFQCGLVLVLGHRDQLFIGRAARDDAEQLMDENRDGEHPEHHARAIVEIAG